MLQDQFVNQKIKGKEVVTMMGKICLALMLIALGLAILFCMSTAIAFLFLLYGEEEDTTTTNESNTKK